MFVFPSVKIKGYLPLRLQLPSLEVMFASKVFFSSLFYPLIYFLSLVTVCVSQRDDCRLFSPSFTAARSRGAGRVCSKYLFFPFLSFNIFHLSCDGCIFQREDYRFPPFPPFSVNFIIIYISRYPAIGCFPVKSSLDCCFPSSFHKSSSISLNSILALGLRFSDAQSITEPFLYIHLYLLNSTLI